MKTAIINNFILECFGPILRKHQQCYLVEIGRGVGRARKAVMFHVGCFTGDGAGLCEITFTHWNTFSGKSRTHQDDRCYRFIRDADETVIYRDSRQHCILLAELKAVFDEKIAFKKAHPNRQFRRLTVEEKDNEKLAGGLGINTVGGELVLGALFDYEMQYELHELYRRNIFHIFCKRRLIQLFRLRRWDLL